MIIPSVTDLIEKWSYETDQGDEVLSVIDVRVLIKIAHLERKAVQAAQNESFPFDNYKDYQIAIKKTIDKHEASYK